MSHPPQPRPSVAEAADPATSELSAVLAQLGPEVVQPLQVALERLQTLQANGNSELAAALATLREPLRRARDGAVMAHQLGRLTSGRVRPAQDRLALNECLEQVCATRRREASVRGLQLRVHLHLAEIQGDPTLVTGLLNSLLDWALTHTRSSIDLNLQLTPWPVRARLRCRFAVRDLDQLSKGPAPDAHHGLNWLLVEHTAALLGVDVKREDEAGVCVAQLDFPVPRLHEVLETLDLGPGHTESGHNTRPFAGWQVLLVCARPELVQTARTTLEPLGWSVEVLASVDAAFQQCLERLPQAIVVDGRLHGPDLEQFSCHVRADAPRFAFIELLPTGGGPLPAIAGITPCREDQLTNQLPTLLRRALAPASQELTFRL